MDGRTGAMEYIGEREEERCKKANGKKETLKASKCLCFSLSMFLCGFYQLKFLRIHRCFGEGLTLVISAITLFS